MFAPLMMPAVFDCSAAIGGCAESLVENGSVVQKLLCCALAFVKTVVFFVLPFTSINCALQPLLAFALLLTRCGARSHFAGAHLLFN